MCSSIVYIFQMKIIIIYISFTCGGVVIKVLDSRLGAEVSGSSPRFLTKKQFPGYAN